jgi:3-dehydroquinate dehydratase/shikimate dehydrogenase
MGPQTMRIAVPIVAENMEDALYDMRKASGVADIIELRLDYMQRPDIRALLESSPVPKIATCRAKNDNGRFDGTEEERLAVLQEAIDLGVEYVDLELNSLRPVSKKGAKLILSYHNFKETPEDLELKSIYGRLVKMGADIPKIATVANSVKDGVRMLGLISEASSRGKDMIGVCMGEQGTVTRVYGPVCGSYLTFARLEKGKESAPGQMTAANLRAAWDLLGYK